VLQVFLDYVDTMTRLPKLLDDAAAESDGAETVPNATRSQEIETLSKQIPRIIALLPDILHRNSATDPRHVAALEEMTKDLLKLVESARPLLLVSTFQIHRQLQRTYGPVLLHSPRFNSCHSMSWMERPRSTLSEELDILDSCRASRCSLFSLGLAVLDILHFCTSYASCFRLRIQLLAYCTEHHFIENEKVPILDCQVSLNLKITDPLTWLGRCLDEHLDNSARLLSIFVVLLRSDLIATLHEVVGVFLG